MSRCPQCGKPSPYRVTITRSGETKPMSVSLAQGPQFCQGHDKQSEQSKKVVEGTLEKGGKV